MTEFKTQNKLKVQISKHKAQNKSQASMSKTKISLGFGYWDLFCLPAGKAGILSFEF